ncbi:sporulation protein [Chitinimonas lacunae]|uniref:Sporulation protein n=1 Tax=Chitinimonas lacunae TaxID=1963018 RepID=A0ABV8MNG4_9NEIS
MFKKLFAAVGIGGAEVDTQVLSPTLVPGQPFRARIVIRGGSAEQDIEGLELRLLSAVEDDEGDVHNPDRSHILARWKLHDRFTLRPGEERIVPFENLLPLETPVTAVNCPNNKARVWIDTQLEIDAAIDSSDRDYLRVEPTPAMALVLDSMAQMGMALHTADVEKGYCTVQGRRSTSGCYQEFEFRPYHGGRISEVEVTFLPELHCTHVLLEIDRRFRGDAYRGFTLQHDQLSRQQVQSYLNQILA